MFNSTGAAGGAGSGSIAHKKEGQLGLVQIELEINNSGKSVTHFLCLLVLPP